MEAEKPILNPSSLIDLKAELHKKYESFRKAKLSQKSDSIRHTTLKRKGDSISKEKKSAPAVLKSSAENHEEELALLKSRLALEAKAKLYEKITSSNILIDDEENERYLVDFQRKVLYSTPIPDSVERLENTKSNSSATEEIISNSCSSASPKKIYNEASVKSDHQNKKIEENPDDQPIHYQNVQFNEIRDHGTGYFAFSTDESKRKKQMEELNILRQQTEEQRRIAQRMQKKRKAALEARLAKVCERRNIDKNVVQKYTGIEEKPFQEESVDLSSIPLPETTEEPPKKEVKIRPWDVGKDHFTPFVPQKHKIRSQNDWIEEKRCERVSEFAPPSLY